MRDLTDDPIQRMTKLATRVLWDEVLHKAKTSIVPLNDQGTKIPIIGIHSIDGRGTEPIKLSKLLGPDQPYYNIRVPSEKRNPAFACSVESIANFYISELSKYKFERVVFVASSGGVAIMLAMAKQMSKMAQRNIPVASVALLVAVDFAPLHGFLYDFKVWVGKEWKKNSIQQLIACVYSKTIELIQLKMRHVPNLCHPTDGLVTRLRLPPVEAAFVKALYNAVDSYRPGKYDGAALFCLATNDVKDKPKNQQQKNEMVARWQRITKQLKVVQFEGDHDTTFKGGDGIEFLAACLQHELADVQYFKIRTKPRLAIQFANIIIKVVQTWQIPQMKH